MRSTVSQYLQKQYNALRRSQQIINQAVARDEPIPEAPTIKGFPPVKVVPEKLDDNAMMKQYFPYDSEYYTFPKTPTDGLILDYDRARKQVPQFRYFAIIFS